jgi:hypothetical protein
LQIKGNRVELAGAEHRVAVAGEEGHSDGRNVRRVVGRRRRRRRRRRSRSRSRSRSRRRRKRKL